MRWLDGIIDPMDMSSSKLREIVKNRGAAVKKPGKLQSMGLQRLGHDFAQTVIDSEGRGSLVCCSSRDCKESDTT